MTCFYNQIFDNINKEIKLGWVTTSIQNCKATDYTGKSFSEALILASVNPQYDERLFFELQEKYMLCTKIVFLF